VRKEWLLFVREKRMKCKLGEGKVMVDSSMTIATEKFYHVPMRKRDTGKLKVRGRISPMPMA
jgi:hypothetical protein